MDSLLSELGVLGGVAHLKRLSILGCVGEAAGLFFLASFSLSFSLRSDDGNIVVTAAGFSAFSGVRSLMGLQYKNLLSPPLNSNFLSPFSCLWRSLMASLTSFSVSPFRM